MKKLIVVVGVLAFAIFLLAFVSEKDTAGEDKTKKIEQTDYVEGSTQSLTVNESPTIDLSVEGNNNPMENTSNQHLHIAHIYAGVMTHNTTFNNGGEPLGKEEIKSFLENMKGILENIKYTGDKEKDIHKAIYLTNQAIKENAQIGDQILEDIHGIVHELNEYFNDGNSDVKVDETGVPIYKKDRIPNYDYKR